MGHHSINLAKLEKLIDVNINLFGNQFNISGNAENINKAKLIISNVYNKLSLKKSDVSEFDFSNFETELRMVNDISSNQKLNKKTDKQEDLNVIKDVQLEEDGSGWLIIDDLVDTGDTARAVRKMLPKAHFATVYAKPAGRPLVDTYITEVSQDTWIFFPWDMEPQPVKPIVS